MGNGHPRGLRRTAQSCPCAPADGRDPKAIYSGRMSAAECPRLRAPAARLGDRRQYAANLTLFPSSPEGVTGRDQIGVRVEWLLSCSGRKREQLHGLRGLCSEREEVRISSFIDLRGLAQMGGKF